MTNRPTANKTDLINSRWSYNDGASRFCLTVTAANSSGDMLEFVEDGKAERVTIATADLLVGGSKLTDHNGSIDTRSGDTITVDGLERTVNAIRVYGSHVDLYLTSHPGSGIRSVRAAASYVEAVQS